METQIAQVTQAQIEQAVRKATTFRGSRMVKIRFKRKAIIGVKYLLGMVLMRTVQLNNGDQKTLAAVARSKNWGDDRNRTATITLTDKFDESWFVGKMKDILKNIEAVKQPMSSN